MLKINYLTGISVQESNETVATGQVSRCQFIIKLHYWSLNFHLWAIADYFAVCNNIMLVIISAYSDSDSPSQNESPWAYLNPAYSNACWWFPAKQAQEYSYRVLCVSKALWFLREAAPGRMPVLLLILFHPLFAVSSGRWGQYWRCICEESCAPGSAGAAVKTGCLLVALCSDSAP